jgi:acyl-CoA synthetase (AMP-forming)/AMP-acid ligase II/acyl carrier protein
MAASIKQVLEIQAGLRPDAPALLILDAPPVAYRRLLQQAHLVGTTLRSAGVGSEDRVAVVLPNGPAMAVAFLGTSMAAACAPLNPGYTAAEFDFYLADLSARAVIVSSRGDSPVREVARKRGIVVLGLSERVGSDGWAVALDVPNVSSAQPYDPPDTQSVALVLHTSGTTSRPKMIRLSHANLCASAANIRSTLLLNGDDCCLNVMPLFHIHGLVGALLASLESGGSVVCTPGFSPARFFEWLEEFSPSWYTAVPTMHHEVLARAPAHRDTLLRSRLRFIRSCSAPLSPDLMAAMEQAFRVPVIEAFGMTEASHQIASNPLPPGHRKPGSVGLPTGCEVAIFDQQGRPMPRGGSGEIVIRGANVTKIQTVPGNDGAEPSDIAWFRTGDVGYLDDDGYLFISGRLKEIINRGGEKIYPSEVDHVLMEHAGVNQAIACAVPDTRLGEEVIAVVVRRTGSAVTERELREFASNRLAAFKIPRRVIFVDQIPKGPTGKIQRIGLARKLGIESLKFAQPSESAPFTAPRTATESAIAQVWSEVLANDRVGLYDNFFELGGDSIAAAEVITQLEARLGVTVNIRDLGFGTLQQVAAGCEERGASGSAGRRSGSFVARWFKKFRWLLREKA